MTSHVLVPNSPESVGASHPADAGASGEHGVFKRCGYCAKTWQDKEQFLNDPSVILAGRRANGMRSFIQQTSLGLLALIHRESGCYAKILVAPERLRDTYTYVSSAQQHQ